MQARPHDTAARRNSSPAAGIPTRELVILAAGWPVHGPTPSDSPTTAYPVSVWALTKVEILLPDLRRTLRPHERIEEPRL